MNRRLLLLSLALTFHIASVTSLAQQTDKMPVVGVLTLTAGADDSFVDALREGLREQGYVEGRNIRIEFRTAHDRADRLPVLAKELVELNVKAIVVTNSLAAQALQRATSTIPIVVALFDPIASGMVANLARPGGNITGLSFMNTELSAKRLELLKETIPRLAKVGFLWNPDMSSDRKIAEEVKIVAPAMSIELISMGSRTSGDFDAAFATFAKVNVQALYVVGGPMTYAHRKKLASLQNTARLPGISTSRHYAEAGGLMSYGPSVNEQLRRSAGYVDKLLKGAKPGELPIEQPTKFELVVNLKAAKALGITVPDSILVRADEVIR